MSSRKFSQPSKIQVSSNWKYSSEEDDLLPRPIDFVTYGVGRIPKETDTYVWNEFTFEVMDMDNLRVDKILVTRQEPEEKEEDAEE